MRKGEKFLLYEHTHTDIFQNIYIHKVLTERTSETPDVAGIQSKKLHVS